MVEMETDDILAAMAGQTYHAEMARGIGGGSLRMEAHVGPLLGKETLLQIYRGRARGQERRSTEYARRLKLEIDALVESLEQTLDQEVAMVHFGSTGTGPSYIVFASAQYQEIFGILRVHQHTI